MAEAGNGDAASRQPHMESLQHLEVGASDTNSRLRADSVLAQGPQCWLPKPLPGGPGTHMEGPFSRRMVAVQGAVVCPADSLCSMSSGRFPSSAAPSESDSLAPTESMITQHTQTNLFSA